MKGSSRFDLPAFVAALDARRIEEDLSWREVARRCAIGSGTICRVVRGKLPDINTFSALIQWLGVGAEHFLLPEPPRAPGSLPARTLLLQGRPATPQQAAALKNLVRAAFCLAKVAGDS